MIDFDYAAPETWWGLIERLRRFPEPHVVGGVSYAPVTMCRDCVYLVPGGPSTSCSLLDFESDDQFMRGHCSWGMAGRKGDGR